MICDKDRAAKPPTTGMTGKCSFDANEVCTTNKGECMANAECVKNGTTDTIFHCKVKAATNAACGITVSDATFAGTPAGCLETTDTCEVSVDPLKSYCKTEAGSAGICKAT